MPGHWPGSYSSFHGGWIGIPAKRFVDHQDVFIFINNVRSFTGRIFSEILSRRYRPGDGRLQPESDAYSSGFRLPGYFEASV